MYESDKFSISLEFDGYQFKKWYPYYGYLSLFSVVIFVILVSLALRTEAKLSERLFIGNMMLTMICYYSYIKLYQFKRTRYYYDNMDADVDNDICPDAVPQFIQFEGPQCYQSVLIPIINDYVLRANVIYIVIYLCFCLLDFLRKACAKMTCYTINACTSFITARCCKNTTICVVVINKKNFGFLSLVNVNVNVKYNSYIIHIFASNKQVL